MDVIAPKNAYPHQVSLQWFSNGKWKHFCGGSIIGPDKISTAAHCLENYPEQHEYRVVAGAHNILKSEESQQIRFFKKVVLHPNYDKETIDYDYAVIYTNMPWKFDKTVSSIELPSKDYEPKGNCVTSGWGITNNGKLADELRHVNLTIVPQESCKSMFLPFGQFITDRMTCAGGMKGKGTCQGDSGGPLVCDNLLVGISSWIFIECGLAGFPSGFANVTVGLEWIQSV
ncbi:unnamed protein product [Allacma fusca]|uniref:Peptidase S1 domain-containing protein n=1 Tax=Allacma fusca TaxID=39272 RepID=A0A8J2P1Y1_9HEXA|nr:unnamed protein product [Allacma fusca]